MRSKLVPSLLVLGLAAGLAGCMQPTNHGNRPPVSRLEQVKPGEQTRDEVRMLLGTPSVVPEFGDDTWYYVSTVKQPQSFDNPETVEREIIAIRFDENGVVADIETLDITAGQEVTPVARKTPTRGREMTILEQAIGNLGRFSTEAEGNR